MQTCSTAFGSLELERYPVTGNPTLQAFDTADVYLLQALAEQPAGDLPVLVINDHFGTLACALASANPQHKPHSWSDSELARLALQANLAHNGLAADAVQFIDSQQLPPGPYSQVLIRVPKSLALMEDQLARLRTQLTGDAVVIAGAMLKHLPHAAGDLLARHIGPYQASLAWKKARLLTARYDQAMAAAEPELTTRYPLPGGDIELTNLPGVFSRDKLDNGTRLLLETVPTGMADKRIIDLGCGNGALGIRAAQLNPEAQLVFVDESHAAIASARMNFQKTFPGRAAEFLVSDGLTDIAPASAALVLCNPPFHQQQAVGDEMAKRLFAQSSEALQSDGSLMVVGNRHLGYHVKLRSAFDRVEQLAANPKFVVLKASR
ncbi:methyltransferase [Halopseudomonas sp.]|uniref:methyltransferase n=1 Tax=Halopseudomonas sp. TaxID=2901191 RepID=UPI001A4A0A73|nr:methyltransferase [Pseudomonas sp.]